MKLTEQLVQERDRRGGEESNDIKYAPKVAKRRSRKRHEETPARETGRNQRPPVDQLYELSTQQKSDCSKHFQQVASHVSFGDLYQLGMRQKSVQSRSSIYMSVCNLYQLMSMQKKSQRSKEIHHQYVSVQRSTYISVTMLKKSRRSKKTLLVMQLPVYPCTICNT